MRGAGLQIEALIEYVALYQQGDSTIGTKKSAYRAEKRSP